MTLDIEPVAQRLLVEAGLRLARLIAVGRPEARAVGRQDLVDQDDLARPGAAELELGVGDDDALLQGDVATVMFSSCPLSALVAGEKIGGSSRPLSFRPDGSFSPAKVALFEYSRHAEPER